MREKYIAKMARRWGLDPAAVLANAAGEGLSGGVGDNGHAFGPFQMNDAGGVLTNDPNPQHHTNAYAWSNAGINRALRAMSTVAKGLHGEAAVRALVTRYERPADIPGAIAARLQYLPRYQGQYHDTGGQVPGAGGHHQGGGQVPQGGGMVLDQGAYHKAAAAAMMAQAVARVRGQDPNAMGSITDQLVAAKNQSMIVKQVKAERTGGAQQGGPGNPPPVGDISTGGGIPGFAKIIGTPYAGTHTLGNWESDNALDIAMPRGTPIRAARSGVIGSQIGALDSTDPAMLGLRLHLEANGQEFYYAHLSKLVVKAGQHVKAGQIIGYSGTANGVNHLHLAVRNGHPNAGIRRRVL